MRQLTLLQIFRAHAMADEQLYTFFDRCICHLLGSPGEMHAQPSVTDALYARGEALDMADEDYRWVWRAE